MRRVGCRGALSVLVALTAAAMLLASCGGTPTASDQRQTPRSRLPKMAGAADPPSCSDAPQGKVVSTSFTSEATGGIEHLRIYTPLDLSRPRRPRCRCWSSSMGQPMMKPSGSTSALQALPTA